VIGAAISTGLAPAGIFENLKKRNHEGAMRRRYGKAVAFLLLIFFSGCERAICPDTPRAYFEKNKVGDCADYAMIKNSDLNDHVATFHGFVDDKAICEKMAAYLNVEQRQGGYPGKFSCVALNH